MKKIYLSIILSLTLTASCLTACGNSSSNADESKPENSSSEVETTTTTTYDSSSEEETTTTTTTAETTTTTAETTTSKSETKPETTTTTTQATTQTTTRATTRAIPKATTRATTRATTKATTKAIIKVNRIIYSDNNVTITYTGYDPNASSLGGDMYFIFQNKSKHKLWICTQDVVIDGWSVDSHTFFTGPRVMAGTKISNHVIVQKRGLESCGLNLLTIKNIELSFRIYNDATSDTFDDFYDTKRVRITI